MGLEGVLGRQERLVKVFPPIWVIFGGQDRVPYKRNTLYVIESLVHVPKTNDPIPRRHELLLLRTLGIEALVG